MDGLSGIDVMQAVGHWQKDQDAFQIVRRPHHKQLRRGRKKGNGNKRKVTNRKPGV